MKRMTVIGLVAGLLGWIAVGGAATATAHSNQVSSTPAADSTVATAPAEVSVEFSADLVDVGTAIVVRSAAGVTVSSGDPVVHRASITIATDADAPPGAYTVAYRVLSKDGHPITASFTYTVAGTPPSAVAVAIASTAASHGTDESGGGPVLGIAIAVVLLGLLAVIGAVALKR